IQYKMKIALFGYGKMGQLIENLATQRGHTVSLVVHQANRTGITIEDLADIDVAIDFSQPAAVLENVRLCFAANTPIVVGTTGWHDALLEIQEECLASNNALIYGSNFSIGVNVLFYINKKLA